MTHKRKLEFIINRFDSKLSQVKIVKTDDRHYAIKRFWHSDEFLKLLGIEYVNNTAIGNLQGHFALIISIIEWNSFYFLGLDSTTNKLCIYLVKSGVVMECSEGLSSIILDRIYKLLRR